MKKTKEQRGITLVALIITVIVLLTLAVVTISAVTDGGIIGHARNTTQKYATGYYGADGMWVEGAVKTEESILGYYSQYLDSKGEVLECTVEDDWGTVKVKLHITDPDELYYDVHAMQGEKIVSSIMMINNEATLKINEGGIYTIVVKKFDGTVVGQKNIEVPELPYTFKKTNADGTVTTVRIGDYVNYTPSGTAETLTVSGEQSGTGNDQTVSKVNEFQWRVLDISDSGEIKLISYPTYGSNVDADKAVHLNGETGSSNANTILDNLCNTFYGAGSDVKEARNLSIYDIGTFAGNSKMIEYYKFTNNDNGTPDDETDDYISYQISTDYNEATGVGTWSEKQGGPTGWEEQGMGYNVYLNGEIWTMDDKTKEYIYKNETVRFNPRERISGYTRTESISELLVPSGGAGVRYFLLTMPNRKSTISSVEIIKGVSHHVYIKTEDSNKYYAVTSSVGSYMIEVGLKSDTVNNESINSSYYLCRPVITLKSSVELKPAIDIFGNETVGTWDIAD